MERLAESVDIRLYGIWIAMRYLWNGVLRSATILSSIVMTGDNEKLAMVIYKLKKGLR